MIHQEPSNHPTRSSRLLLAAIVAGGLLAASPTPPRTGLPVASPTEVAVMVAEAERLMNAGTWAEAARAWSQVETADPGLAEAAYNRGVAEYRAGELSAAAEAFRRAAEVGDADLAAQAMYNEGTARYADAVKRLSTEAGDATPSPSGDTETPSDPLEDAMERVGLSLDHFRDAIDADPGNRDARANAELAHRLLQRLQEIKEQSQNEEQQGEQSQDEQQQGEQSQDEQQQGEQSQDEQQQGEQSQDEQQQGEQSQDQSSDDEGEAGENASEDGRMSREEAERLLQSVRDKERQRRRARAEAESQTEDRRPPARKDW